MKKVAVFIPDWFWSSIPYEGLTMFLHLKNKMKNDVELLMFENDIRLKRSFDEKDKAKYRFNKQLFLKENPRLIKDWMEFMTATGDYKLVVTGTHIAPKVRLPEMLFPELTFKKELKCPLLMTDIGGTDLFVKKIYSTHICVKGPIWKEYFIKSGYPAENIFVTGTPQYDYYLHADKIFPVEARPLGRKAFYEKYNILQNKELLLVAPSNPGSHKNQFCDNFKTLKRLNHLAKDRNYQILIKTYPNDYVYYDRSDVYNGIYHRMFQRGSTQYDLVATQFQNPTIVESQDHFSAIMHSDKMYNMSGSHVAWETYYTKCNVYTLNYKKQPYYGGAHYLPEGTRLPDSHFNVHLKNIEQIFTAKKFPDKNCPEYMTKEFAHENIAKVIEKMI